MYFKKNDTFTNEIIKFFQDIDYVSLKVKKKKKKFTFKELVNLLQQIYL